MISLPIVAEVLIAWLASLVGSGRVLTVSPMQATKGAPEKSSDGATATRRRGIVTIVFFAFVGGLVVLGSSRVTLIVLSITGRMFGQSAPARVAAENAARFRDRVTRPGTFSERAGAQSLLGPTTESPGLVLSSIPVGPLVILAGKAAVLTPVASVTPSRHAPRISLVVALAAE